MADENPKGRGAAVALQIPADHVRIVFQMALRGIREELDDYPKQLKEPARLRREESAYGRLLVALDELVIVLDSDVQDVLADLAGIVDRGNEYSRVVEEHEALHRLLAQLRGGGDR